MAAQVTSGESNESHEAASPRNILAVGEILWDQLPTVQILGGAPMNFAYRIASLGDNVSIVSRLGDDDLGGKAADKLAELGVDGSLVQTDTSHPTGIVDIEFDSSGATKINVRPNAAFDYIQPDSAALLAAERADCICYGTVVQRQAVSRNTLEALLDQAENALKVLDINLRDSCFTTEIVEKSLGRADVLKLNGPEAGALSRMFGLSLYRLEEFVGGVLARWPIRVIVVTLEDQGALAASADGECVYSPGFKVDVADTLGAGDAFTAGFVHQYLHGRTLAESCRYGNVMGALVASQPGATAPLGRSDFLRFLASPPPVSFDPRLRGCFAEEK
jgi:fructokinase